MIKSNKSKKAGYFKQSVHLLYINISIFIVLAALVLSGCSSSAPLVNSPTPLQTPTTAPTSTPAANAKNLTDQQLTTTNNAAPIYDETYPLPEVIGNTGANIENGGLSTSDRNRIYYIDSGIWSINKNGNDKIQITDFQNISCLNNAGDYLYFISSHDGTVYRVEKSANAIPKSLNITGASNLIIIDNYMYYCSTTGENATEYIYKSPLNGIVQECLFVKSSSLTPDGAYFYFNNLEDDSTLWRYDTISSQTVKISNDKASQINIIDDKLYYISQDLDYNVVCIDRSGLNQVTVVTQGCTDLNIIQNYLIYRTIDTGYIQSYNMKSGDTVTLVSYGELFSLSATDSMLFFQSCPADGFEPETYMFNIASSKLNKPLPQKIYAYIKSIDLETLTFDYDRVEFFEGEDAIAQYSAYNSTTAKEAQEALQTEDGIYYIYNKQQAWIRCQSHDWSNITLIRRLSSIGNSTPYTASLEDIQALFDNNPNTYGKLLFELTIVDKKVVEMNEIYYTIDNNN